MMNIINLRQTCSLPSNGRVGVGSLEKQKMSVSHSYLF
jgi:hypothetical protein